MIDDSECIPTAICMAIEAGKEKMKKIEEAELNFQSSIREMIGKQNKKYRELIAEQIPNLLKPYVLLDEITWPFSSEPENVQPSQQVRVTINGLPEFAMEWDSIHKIWIAFLPNNSSTIDYCNKIAVDDVEILLAELYQTILELEH